MTEENEDKVIDFTSTKAVKEFIETANERILELEQAHYLILETNRIDVIKEISANVLGEDLEIYLEEDSLDQLDFDDEELSMGLPDEELITP